MSVASRWAGYVKRTGSTLGVAAGTMSPAGELSRSVTVELWIDEAWVDISPYVKYTDGINIRRGRGDETSNISPSSCTMTLINTDGRFSFRNPTSLYYGKIGRNTRIRVSVVRNGIRRYRFYGEISSWPIQADISGQDVTVSIEAAGVSRRLGQGVKPLSSTLYRAITHSASGLIDYWPMEDVVGSTVMGSAVGGHSLTFVGSPTLHSFSSFGGSDDLPVWDTTTEFKALLQPYTAGNYLQARFLLAAPATGGVGSSVLLRFSTTGTAAMWDVFYSPGSGGQLGVTAYDADSVVALLNFAPASADGSLLLVSLELTQSGANIDYAVRTVAHGSSTINTIASGTLAGYTFGRATTMVITPAGGNEQFTLGHFHFQNVVTSASLIATDLNGDQGESAGRRIERLCGQESVSFHAIGDLDECEQMGAQKPGKLLDLVQDATDVDLGMLIEPRDDLGFTYRTRNSLYNQSAALTLDHSANALSRPMTDTADDQLTRNDITVNRVSGSSYVAELVTGALSIQDPPNGVGRYTDAPEINLYSDTRLPDHAFWRLRQGTVEDSRFPDISIQLSHPTFDDVSLAASALSIDLGDRLVVTNPPSWLPPDDISQIVQGYSERIDQFLHEITFNCSPESVYRVGVTDDDVLGRADTEGSELTSDISSTAASVSVTTTSGPIWTTDAADFPFDVRVGGEVMTVTNITGASSPQTFTVTRSINGVVKSQAAGTDVALDQPSYVPLMRN